MTTRLDTDEIESTRTERFLAVILTAFLLVGSIWFYFKLDGWIQDDDAQRSVMTTEQQAVIDASNSAWRRSDAAFERERKASQQLELVRADYDIALQAGDPAADLKREYNLAKQQHAAAATQAEKASQAATQAAEHADEVYKDVDRKAGRINTTRDWVTAGLRFLFVGGWIAGSFLLIRQLRQRESRYLPISFAAAATGAILTLIFAVDYITDYIDPLELGPIVLSALGAALTIGTFVALQRRIVARIPGRRVRRGECPFCGHPVRDQGPHCEGCGREVVAPCTTCEQPRRVGAAHCAACGAN